MSKKPRLGRGLDALLGSSNAAAPEPVTELPLGAMTPGRYQPRAHFDPASLAELAASIRSSGVIQPLIVRPVGEGRYELIAGERRWRAAGLAGLAQVPVVVRVLSDAAALAVALIENIQREDLNPVEEARALQRLIEEFDLTHEQAAERVGRSRVAVTNLLRLLALDETVLAALAEGRLDMGHGRALLSVDAAEQRRLTARILDEQLSVRAVEALIQQQRTPRPVTTRAPADPDIRALEQELSENLGARVRLAHKARGGGRLIIEYGGAEELDGLLARLRTP